MKIFDKFGDSVLVERVHGDAVSLEIDCQSALHDVPFQADLLLDREGAIQLANQLLSAAAGRGVR